MTLTLRAHHVLRPLLTALLCGGVLGGCSPPAPGVHERLRISDRGEFSLDGRLIPREGLQAAIAEEQRLKPALFAEISASPRADIETIRFAVATLQASKVRFAFVDESIMGTGQQKGTPAE